ncbi:RHS repeat protein [Luteimonas galliterrae]|uniref:RHS repeat protein n=1 Tax=Luteimonas galliterrae TaxID=2940486 RepID=UPI00201A0F1A|nr:RHS repeat protein [Luteimonas galliterrae]
MFRRIASLAAVFFLVACGTAAADELSAFDGALRSMQIDERVKPQSDTPFGEQVNPYIGSVSFKQADVVVPGNGPTISLVRDTLTPRNNYRSLVPHAFGDWTLSVPQIHTIAGKPGFGGGTIAEYWDIDSLQTPYARCTQIGPLDTDSVVNTLWWEGYEMITEDGERQALLKRDPDNTAKPTMTLNGQPVVFPVVTEKNWQIGCLPNTSNGEVGEAFLAVSPDGTKYWFDRLVGDGLETIKEMDDGVIVRQSLRRARMLVTRIEDRFGNYLTYAYDDKKLTSITASDGRRVDIAWRADYALVDSITVQPAAVEPRVWRYEYTNLGDTTSQLTGVVLPDLTRWSFSLHPQTSWIQTNMRPCGIRSGLPASSATATQTLTSPSGATGTFTYKQVWHARYVVSACVQMPNIDPYEETPALFTTQSLIQKQVSGPGLATQTWTYAYQPAVGAASYDPCAQNGTCPTTKWVDVTEPDADRTRYTYSISQGTDGRLLDQDTYDGATLLRSETYEYAAANQGPWPAMLGSPMANGNLGGAIFQWTPMKKRTLVQQGTTYLWQVNNFDTFAKPLSVTRSSAPGGYTRTDTTLYDHNFGKWVIGQVTTSTNTNTGLVEVETDYDNVTAQPLSTKSFGKLRQTMTYHADGTLATAKDGNNNVTTFANWKRGVPQKVTYADTKYKSASVDDFGQLTWVEDENRYRTCYDYDVMGRLTGITYPSEAAANLCNTTTWAKTTLSFAKNGSAVYGLPAGHWYQSVVTGNGRKVTYFDALWRPVVATAYDNANIPGTLSQTVTRYDSDGRSIFISYPQRELSAAVYNTWANPAIALTLPGTGTTYDALGRVVHVKQDSELGVLTTTTAYLSNADGPYTVVTNPRSFQTRTWFQAYDQPNYDMPVEIWHPEATRTVIDRDVFGKLKTLTRRNDAGTVSLARSYAYFASQELCRTIEPETGATDFGYDGAGNLKWSAAGLPTNIGCDVEGDHSVIAPRRVDRTYDARNRLELLSFPDGRGNQQWQYWDDGLVKQVTTYNDIAMGGQVDNAYAYNKRRLLQSESIAEPGNYSWALGYGYNANGHLASHQYPGGLVVNYAPNALGQPTQAGSYATGVSYYPNGAMQQFTYGNGVIHQLTQNTRGLPDRSLDIYQSTHYLDDGYDYDQNGNVAAISDGRDAEHRGNRTMTYDGLDRLQTAVSPMFGNASYGYDVLDNLTRVTIGGPAIRDHYYCYDGANRLTNVKTGNCSGTSVIGLGYDVQGNIANKNGQTFDFDYGNRLREATGKEAYRYDGHGRRVAALAPAGTIYSFYGQDGALRSQRDERRTEAYDYIRLNGSLVARVTGTTPVIGTPVVSAPASDPDGNYTVQWTTVTAATQYELQESINGGAWQAAYVGAGTNKAIGGKPAGSYGYRARACKSGPCGNWSAAATVVVNQPPASAPTLTAPTTAANGNYNVSWSAISGATGYTLEESTNGGAWTAAYTGLNLSKAYTGKSAGSYGYRIKACNEFGCSAYSAAKTVQAVYAPAAPVLNAPASSTNGSYAVSWAAIVTAASYRLEESVNNDAWTLVQDAAALSKTFSGKANGSYRYRAQACNVAGCSAYSALKTVSVLLPPAAAPGLTAPASNATGSYAVSWTAVATSTSYTLQRSVNGGAWSNRYSGANLSFNESGLGAGSYGYRVQACNGSGCSAFSATKTTTVQFPPAMPASLTGNTDPDPDLPGSRNFYVFWSAVSGATSYELQEGGTTVYSGPLTNYMTSGKGTRTFNVRACNAAGCSAWKGPLVL